MYSIGEVSKMFQIPISTLRYYDKEGLFLGLEKNNSGIRIFNEKTIDALRLIECLKKSGMQIKDIKEFMKWCSMGDKTLKIRKEMFLKQKKTIEKEIEELNNALELIKYKCWYYDEAVKDNSEKRVKNITPSQMPSDIKKAYENSHK